MKTSTNSTKNQRIFLVVMYTLGFAACCSWPYQNAAHNIFVFFTVLMTSIPVVMLVRASEIVKDTVRDVKADPKGTDMEIWKKAPRRISWSCIPMILMLVLNGFWFMTVLWIFMYVVMMGFGAKTLETLKEEFGDGTASGT